MKKKTGTQSSWRRCQSQGKKHDEGSPTTSEKTLGNMMDQTDSHKKKEEQDKQPHHFTNRKKRLNSQPGHFSAITFHTATNASSTICDTGTGIRFSLSCHAAAPATGNAVTPLSVYLSSGLPISKDQDSHRCNQYFPNCRSWPAITLHPPVAAPEWGVAPLSAPVVNTYPDNQTLH